MDQTIDKFVCQSNSKLKAEAVDYLHTIYPVLRDVLALLAQNRPPQPLVNLAAQVLRSTGQCDKILMRDGSEIDCRAAASSPAGPKSAMHVTPDPDTPKKLTVGSDASLPERPTYLGEKIHSLNMNDNVQKQLQRFNETDGEVPLAFWLQHAESVKSALGPQAMAVELAGDAIQLTDSNLTNLRMLKDEADSLRLLEVEVSGMRTVSITTTSCLDVQLANLQASKARRQKALSRSLARLQSVRYEVSNQVGRQLVADVCKYDDALETLLMREPTEYKALVRLVASLANRGPLKQRAVVQVVYAGAFAKARVEAVRKTKDGGEEVTVSVWNTYLFTHQPYEEGFDTRNKLEVVFPRDEVYGGAAKITQRISEATTKRLSQAARYISDPKRPEFLLALYDDASGCRMGMMDLGKEVEAHVDSSQEWDNELAAATSKLVTSASTGSVQLQVSSAGIFKIGDVLIINPNGTNQERVKIATVAPNLFLRDPVQHDHVSGEVVVHAPCKAIVPGLKGMARATVKTAEKYEGMFDHLTDLARMTFVCITAKAAISVIKFIRDHPLWIVVRIKDRLHPLYDAGNTGGYRDLLINARDKASGHLVEIQVTFKSFYDIKAGGGHSAYKLARLLDLNSTETTCFDGRLSWGALRRVRLGLLRKVRCDNVEVSWTMRDALLSKQALLSSSCAVTHLHLVGIAGFNGVDLGSERFVAVFKALGPFLQELSVMDCGVEGKLTEAIAEHCNQLEILDLRKNPRLVGEIPKNFGRLVRLRQLALNQTGLSGAIPWDAILQMTRLQGLHLYKTELSGEIPQSIGKLNQLQDLSLNDMNLSGELPAGIGELEHLQRLFLNNTKLQGKVPSTLAGLKQLRKLFLNQTDLIKPSGATTMMVDSDGEDKQVMTKFLALL